MTAPSSERPAPDSIDHAIRMTDALIAAVIKIDPVATTLLGLAKAELVTRKAVEEGGILPFPPQGARAR